MSLSPFLSPRSFSFFLSLSLPFSVFLSHRNRHKHLAKKTRQKTQLQTTVVIVEIHILYLKKQTNRQKRHRLNKRNRHTIKKRPWRLSLPYTSFVCTVIRVVQFARLETGTISQNSAHCQSNMSHDCKADF